MTADYGTNDLQYSGVLDDPVEIGDHGPDEAEGSPEAERIASIAAQNDSMVCLPCISLREN